MAAVTVTAAESFIETDPAVLRLLPPRYPVARVQVNTAQLPWRAIGRVALYGGKQYCTGTLISERHVLTAAHCVWRVRQFPHEVHFLAGFQRDQYAAHTTARQLTIAPAYAALSSEQRRTPAGLIHDWAVITLSEPIGQQVGFIHWAAVPATYWQLSSSATPTPVTLAGYRADRAGVQTADQQCHVDGATAAGQLLLHSCPLMHGDSGGPLLLRQGDQSVIIGMDVAGIADANSTPLAQRPQLRRGIALALTTIAPVLQSLGVTPTAVPVRPVTP